MKFVKNVVFATVLASVLAVSASAGEQATPGVWTPPPPPAPGQALTNCNDGTVICDPDPENTETSDYLFYEALAALLSMY